jgi:putative membrane protein
MNLMMWGGYGMNGWGWGFGALIVVGVVVLIVVVVRLASTRGARVQPAEPPRSSLPNDAGRILDERYAKGDLTTEEYRERKTALGLDDR